MYDLIIVGAGAAGSVAALMASELDLKILLCDCNQIIGRKILSTGNGRCNFTNKNLNTDFYYADDKKIIEDIIHNFDSDAIISYFKSLGIYSKENDSYIYPITNSAATVQKVISDKILNDKKIEFLSDNVIDVRKDDGYFDVIFSQNGSIKGKMTLIATGGLAKASLGNNKNGLKIARRLGHSVNTLLPALVHLKSSSKLLKDLAKQRVFAKVSIVENGKLTEFCDRGEVQFNKDNISGIPVMNISSPVSAMLNLGSDVDLLVDFVPYLSADELTDELNLRLESGRGLEGLIPEKTIDALGLRDLRKDTILQIISKLKNMCFDITGTGSFEDAQVMRGGVPFSEVKEESLESIYVNNLYFAGEILDVDAMCGGYNLTFAFASAKRVIDAIKNDKSR